MCLEKAETMSRYKQSDDISMKNRMRSDSEREWLFMTGGGGGEIQSEWQQ